jgi:hypothetical protein
VELYLHCPNTPQWRGARLRHRDKFTFNFININIDVVSVMMVVALVIVRRELTDFILLLIYALSTPPIRLHGVVLS